MYVSSLPMVGNVLAHKVEKGTGVKLRTTKSHAKCRGHMRQVDPFPMWQITDLSMKIKKNANIKNEDCSPEVIENKRA